MEGIVDDARAGVAPARRRSQAASRDMATAYSHDAELLMKQRRYAEAETLLKQALRLRPDDADIMNHTRLSPLGTRSAVGGRVFLQPGP